VCHGHRIDGGVISVVRSVVVWFVLLGLALVGGRLAGVDPVVGWSWPVVLAPFGLAVLWWWWADRFGYTRRKAEERMEQRRDQRRQQQIEGLRAKDKRR